MYEDTQVTRNILPDKMNDKNCDIALKEGTISFASSTYGGLLEPQKMLDGRRTTYWATSGMYPQQFILSFSKTATCNSIKLRSFLVRAIRVEKGDSNKPEKFETISEKEIEYTDIQHQMECLFEGSVSAQHIRFTILSGYDHICAIYKIEVQGIILHDEDKNNTDKSLKMNGNGKSQMQSETPLLQLRLPSTSQSPQSSKLPQSLQLPQPRWPPESDDHLSTVQIPQTSEEASLSDINEEAQISITSQLSFKHASSPNLGHFEALSHNVSQKSQSITSLETTAEISRPSTAKKGYAKRHSQLTVFSEAEEEIPEELLE